MKNMNKYKFSVITVVKDDMTGLRETYASLLAQKCVDYEWIVVDGDSGVEIVGFLESITSNNLNWLSERDNGIYDAMNKGVLMSKGGYVVFMNAGDVFFNNEVLLDIHESLSASRILPDVLFGEAQLVFQNGNSWIRKPRRLDMSIWHGLPAHHQATYYRRDFLPKPAYDSSYKICGDYYIAASLFLLKPVASYIDKPLVKFKIDGVSFYNPIPLVIEANRIQKTVLHMSRVRRLKSTIRRLLTISMAVIIHKVKVPR